MFQFIYYSFMNCSTCSIISVIAEGLTMLTAEVTVSLKEVRAPYAINVMKGASSLKTALDIALVSSMSY